MKIILALFLCFPIYAKTTAAREVARFEKSILNGQLPEKSQAALGVLLNVAAAELVKHDHFVEAEQLVSDWNNRYSKSYLAFARNSRDIGDHQAWFPWLADKLNMLRLLLGDDILRMTHISDLYTFVYAPYVVFRPCTFNMDFVTGERIDEYRRHFNEGDSFYGLTSVCVYWLTYGAVTGATMGTGWVFISGAIGSVAEKLYATFVGGKLSDWTYNKSCTKNFDANSYY